MKAIITIEFDAPDIDDAWDALDAVEEFAADSGDFSELVKVVGVQKSLDEYEPFELRDEDGA